MIRVRDDRLPMVRTGHETIVALSSGQGRSGVAVIRASGPAARFISETILDKPLTPRRMTLVTATEPVSREVLDRCLAVLFPGPASATGEDLLELHVHGGPAIISSVLRVVSGLRHDVRLAQPGEFTRRSFENGKLDLVQVEALGDALEAQSTAQLQQAQRLLEGELSRRLDDWGARLVDLRSLVEAELDFSDEGDVSTFDEARFNGAVRAIVAEVQKILAGAERGRLTREGARIVLAGAPNVGKSSLLNALAERDIAIVTDLPGTTRDVLRTSLEIRGWPIQFIDIAGLRTTDDLIEREGIRRAHEEIAKADLVLELIAPDLEVVSPIEVDAGQAHLRVGTKCDIGRVADVDIHVSALTKQGLSELVERILTLLELNSSTDPPLVARERHREELQSCVAGLLMVLEASPLEVRAEGLRHAQIALGRLKGHSDVERVLDRLFSSFCIGK